MCDPDEEDDEMVMGGEDEEEEEEDREEQDEYLAGTRPRSQAIHTAEFAQFARPNSGARSSGDYIDVQVVDIECQQRPRIPEMDDPDVFYETPRYASWRDDGEERQYTPTVPCMRVYGKLRDGSSVCVNVYGYYPVVHVLTSCPAETIVPQVRDAIEDGLAVQARRGSSAKHVCGARVVPGFPLYPYTEQLSNFIELKLSRPGDIKAVGELLLRNPELSLGFGAKVSVLPFSCIPVVEQFQAACGISGWGWIRVHAWRQTDTEAPRCEPSRCALEVDVCVRNIVPVKDDAVAPLRNLTFDIECKKTLGIPTPQKNEVILISSVCTDYEDGNPVRKRRVLFQFRSSEPVSTDAINPENGDLHFHFDNEADMLNSFGSFIRAYDPDYLSGHNVINFDIPYIVERADILECCEDALYLGRRGSWKWAPPRRFVKHRKNGDAREACSTDTPGRAQLDTMTWIMGQKKERSYSLNYLATKYLGDRKMDVSPNIICQLFETNDATRRRIAEYGMKDSVLTELLVCYPEFDMVRNSIEESRQTRVPAPRLLKSGMQARVWGRILEKARSPRWDPENHPVFVPYERPKNRAKDDKFAGAEVLQPFRGFYPGYVVCGDFRSLYPSIIIYRMFPRIFQFPTQHYSQRVLQHLHRIRQVQREASCRIALGISFCGQVGQAWPARPDRGRAHG